MGKFFVRITIILVTIYLFISFIVAQFYGIDILRNSYCLLFELCVVIYCFSEGKYHCQYIRWTALGILVTETISHLDYYFNFIPLNNWVYVPTLILLLGVCTSFSLALRHFYKVSKLLNKRKKINGK